MYVPTSSVCENVPWIAGHNQHHKSSRQKKTVNWIKPPLLLPRKNTSNYHSVKKSRLQQKHRLRHISKESPSLAVEGLTKNTIKILLAELSSYLDRKEKSLTFLVNDYGGLHIMADSHNQCFNLIERW